VSPIATFYVKPELKVTQDCGKVTISNCGLSGDYYIDLLRPDQEKATIISGTDGDLQFNQFQNKVFSTDYDDSVVLSPTVDIHPSGEDPPTPTDFTFQIEPSGKLEINIPVEGIYVIEITSVETIDETPENTSDDNQVSIVEKEYRVVYDMCNIEQCILDLLNDIRCLKPNECEDYSQELYKMMAIKVQYDQLVSIIEQYSDDGEAGYQSFLSIPSLEDADDLIEFLNGYCGDCGPIGNIRLNDCDSC